MSWYLIGVIVFFAVGISLLGLWGVAMLTIDLEDDD